MQDFTGVPAVVDLAAMRDAMKARGGDPDKINPLAPTAGRSIWWHIAKDKAVAFDDFTELDVDR